MAHNSRRPRCLDIDLDPLDMADAPLIAARLCPDCPLQQECLQVAEDLLRGHRAENMGTFGGYFGHSLRQRIEGTR